METSVPAGGLSRARDFMAPGKLLYFEKQHDHHHQVRKVHA